MQPLLALFRPLVSLLSILFFVAHKAIRFTALLIQTPLDILLKLPGAEALRKRFTEQAPLEWLARRAKKRAAPDNLLVNDRRREYAESIADPKRYPTLYSAAPEELQRSIVSDGRVVNGMAPATALAPQAVTPELVIAAYRRAVVDGLHAAWLVLLTGLGISVLTFGTLATAWSHLSQMQREGLMPGEGQMQTVERTNPAIDVWNDADLSQIRASRARHQSVVNAGQSVARFVGGLGTLTILAAALVSFAVGVGGVVWIARFRGLVLAAAEHAASGLRSGWREALQRHRFRRESRELEASAHARAVEYVNARDHSPMIQIGTAMGVTEFRGMLGAPRQGQTMQLSLLDLTQHTLVLGASGEGKTRDVALPVLRQLLALRAVGYPVGFYCTDGKGVLWQDVLSEARHAGCEQDLRIVGTDPGQWRVDLLSNVPPMAVADIMKSVARQLGGPAADDFWPDMGSAHVHKTALICQAYELTTAGTRWVRESGYRAYSLRNIIRIASSDELLTAMISDVLAALIDPQQYPRIAQFDKQDLYAAIEGLIANWFAMADATKSGIVANAEKALRLFAFQPELSAGFADGSGPDLLSPEDLFGKYLIATNISGIEFGAAGRLVATMLKTLLFREASMALKRNPGISKRRLKWWSNPDLSKPFDPEYAFTFFIADEYQDLVTSDPAGGLSDASVWNMAREYGLGAFIMTQGMASIRLAVGADAAANIAGQLRTKIVLRLEDLDTIEYVQKLAGKTTRYTTIDSEHSESSVAARREWGAADPDNIRPVDFKTVSSIAWGKGLAINAISIDGFREMYSVDDRFVPEGPSQVVPSPNNNAMARLSALQAAHWRQEDLTRSALTQGSSQEAVYAESDIMQMGRGRACVFLQRGGITMSDIVELNTNTNQGV